MFDNLTGLGIGLVTFALVVGIGIVMLYNFGGSVGCPTGFVWNGTAGNCYESTNTSNTTSPTGTAYTSINYMEGQLGQSGLAGWTPAIIAFSVGMLFLGAFLIGKGGSRKY